MERQEVVRRLVGLRKELEADKVLENDITLSLFLADVCNALELDNSETLAVLGMNVNRQVKEWKAAVCWPTTEEETAVSPLPEFTAVPA